MTLDLQKYKDELLFLPIGGTQEIGANSYLYHYNGKWILVDLGIGFADDYFPGVDLLVPDISFLLEIKDDIVGLILTHAHEDHIGAVPYLWSELKLPIYTTKFTSSVVRTKLAQMGLTKEVPIHEIKQNSKFKVGDFDLEFVGLTHSAPEMQGLIIDTPKGKLFHTGDWKLDPDPIIGEPSNLARLKKLGKENVLAMICDSTNIFNAGRSGSEGELKKSIEVLIAGFKKNLVVFTTFASNVARIHTIISSAQKAGRKVVLAGTSLWRMVECAKESGYLGDIGEVYRPRDISNLKRSEVLVIATGCQGEPLAATAKLARGEHPDFKLSKNDIVVFASRIIPGNETKIARLFDNFCHMGVEVLTEKDHFVHVSGHPAKEEVAEMYNMVKPKISIPMHGHAVHIKEHCTFAKSLGVPQAVAVEDGKILLLSEEQCEFVGQIPIAKMAIDGHFIIPADSEILKMRRKMRDSGLVTINIILSSKGKLLKNPSVLAPGVLDSSEDWEIIDMIVGEVRDFIEEARKIRDADLENKLRSIVRRTIKSEVGKEPRIFITIHKINL